MFPTAPHSQRIGELADELRTMKEGDERRDALLEEMRTLLLEEFNERHEQQGREIQQTADRLESLRKMHEQREQMKDQIVTRRIDQLIGQPDVLDWNPGHIDLPQRFDFDSQSFNRLSPPAGSAAYGGGQADYRDPIVPEPNSRPTRPPTFPSRDSTTGRVPPPGLPPGLHDAMPLGAPPLIHESVTSDAEVQQPRRIEVSASVSGDVFPLARRLSTAMLSELTAKEDWERSQKLHERAVITSQENRKAELKLEQAKRDLEFARAEWQALEERLNRDLEFAKMQSERSEQRRALMLEAVANGVESERALLEVDDALEQARKAFQDVDLKWRQFDQARKMIGGFDDAPNTPHDATPSQPVGESVNKRVRIDVDNRIEETDDSVEK